jgi:hypothetical protein
MSAAYEPSITSEILRLCNGDTIPAPPPDDEEPAPRSSVKELVRTSEPHLDTIPAPPPAPSSEDVEKEPPTLPGPPKLPANIHIPSS